MFGELDKYLLAFFSALVVTYLLTPRIRAIAIRLGVMDLPNERRPHKQPTARGGGLAVVIGVHVACLVVLFIPGSFRSEGFDLNWWLGFAPGSVILLVVGLLDDIRGLRPLTKLAGQVAAAALVCASGTTFGSILGFSVPPLLDGILAVLWIVAVINAFNLIDGLDGLASGLAVISATGLCGIMLLGNLPGVLVVLVALIGACLAFLRYNFHPATIFLGDTGSMFIGFVLGVISLQTVTKGTFILSMAIPMLVLGVPIYDALLAVWRRSVRRLLQGDNGTPGIMSADLEHLHHRLLRSGLSTRRVATVLFSINAGLMVFGLLLTTFKSHAAGIFLFALLLAAYVLMRHMAVIEIRDTGRFLLTGLRRPTHALFKALIYPLWDTACLLVCLAVAMWYLENVPATRFWHDWFLDLPIWVTPTISLLAVSRTYVTIWTRARVLDVLMLLFTLQIGLALSVCIALLIDPAETYRWLLRALVIGSAGHAAIVGSRIFYRCMEEIVVYLRSKSESTGDHTRVALYGAGGRCQLFLKERSFNNSSSFDGRTIVGLIDDEPTLHSKWVHGYPVLGGRRDLERLIARHDITGIIVTAGLPTETLDELRELARRLGVRLSEWSFHETESIPLGRAVESRAPAPLEPDRSSSTDPSIIIENTATGSQPAS